jgi:hypothetical protein
VVRFIILTSHSLRQQDSTDAKELLEEGEREEGRKSGTPHSATASLISLSKT